MSIIKKLGIPKIERLGLDRPYKKEDEELTGGTNSSSIQCVCKVHTKARTINDLISLVKDAEAMMIQNKLTDIADRINCLRGIYYGATWSMDYEKEKSENRNKGFYIYTGLTTVEHDARRMLKCSDQCKGELFQALYQSPEVFDNTRKTTDFGHLMIGLDARISYIARNTNLPFGGTGLENVTWIGDIGGGAGMLAYRRTQDSKTRAKKLVYDSTHDYGASVNIEGDIAGYIVGYDYKNYNDIVDPSDNINYIYQGLQNYFDKDWTARVNAFIGMIGGKLEKGALTNRREVLNNMIDSVEGFAQFYITIRASDKSFDQKRLILSFGYIESCAREVCEIFLDGLLSLRTHPNSTAFMAVTDPEPTLVSTKEIQEKIKDAGKIMERIRMML